MKIILHAFGKKLSGVMEIPEETGPRFRLALTQPIQVKTMWGGESVHPMMNSPIDTICEFEWTGGTYAGGEDHPWSGAREYQLVSIDKR